MPKLTYQEYKGLSSMEAPFNRPNNYDVEGEDHINICITSNLPLGRILDPGYCYTFEYPTLGKFKSILSLSYWLKSPSGDDTIRMLKGHKLKKYVKENNLGGKQLPNYYAILAKATWIRIKSREDIVEKIKQLPDNIPLLSYNTNKVSNVRITTSYAYSVVIVAAEIIQAVKEDRLPDFDKFANDEDNKGNNYLEGIL